MTFYTAAYTAAKSLYNIVSLGGNKEAHSQKCCT